MSTLDMMSQVPLMCIALPARYAVRVQIAADMLFDLLSIAWVSYSDVLSQTAFLCIFLPTGLAVHYVLTTVGFLSIVSCFDVLS
jgi:hypothetical protein